MLKNVIVNAESLKMQVRAWAKNNGIPIKQASNIIFGDNYNKLQHIITAWIRNKKLCDQINEKTWLKLAIKVETIEV